MAIKQISTVVLLWDDVTNQFIGFQDRNGAVTLLQALPNGGAAGQVLKKNSSADGDATWQEDVAGSGGVTDGGKGDITVSGGGSVWTIPNSTVTTAKMGGDVTAAGKTLLTAADAAAQRTALAAAADSSVVHTTGNETVAGTKTFSSSPVLPTPTAGDNTTLAATTAFVQTRATSLQPLDAKLTGVAAGPDTAGLWEQTAADTFAVRAIGVAADTSIPTRANVDTRFARMFSAMPAGSVGLDGDYGILDAVGLRAVLIKKTAGAWGVVSESFTFAQMLAIASPTTGSTVLVSTIDLGGGVGVRTLNALFRYDGTNWKPLYPITLVSTIATTASITNSVTAFQSCLSMTPPVSLFLPGMVVEGWLYSNSSGAGAATHMAQIHAAGSLLASTSAAITTNGIAHPRLWCRAANVLRAGGGPHGAGWVHSSGSAMEVMASPFDGSTVTMQFGATFSATGSDKTVVFEWINLRLYP